jgi:hypothetical protein
MDLTSRKLQLCLLLLALGTSAFYFKGEAGELNRYFDFLFYIGATYGVVNVGDKVAGKMKGPGNDKQDKDPS